MTPLASTIRIFDRNGLDHWSIHIDIMDSLFFGRGVGIVFKILLLYLRTFSDHVFFCRELGRLQPSCPGTFHIFGQNMQFESHHAH
jgi:hypothetical protein